MVATRGEDLEWKSSESNLWGQKGKSLLPAWTHLTQRCVPMRCLHIASLAEMDDSI
jgi:hypothetical protein